MEAILIFNEGRRKMLIDKETLIKMRERHDRRSRRALERYEISGLQRDQRDYVQNDELTAAIDMALNSYDSESRIGELEASMFSLANRALKGEDITEDLIITAENYGLIKDNRARNVDFMKVLDDIKKEEDDESNTDH